MKTKYVNRWKTTIWNMKFAKVNSTKRLIQHEPISCITKVTEDMEIIKKTYCQNKTKIQAMENTWNTLWRRKTGCTKVIKQVFKLKKMIRKIQQSTMSSNVTQKSLMKLNSYQSKSRFEHFSSTSLFWRGAAYKRTIEWSGRYELPPSYVWIITSHLRWPAPMSTTRGAV